MLRSAVLYVNQNELWTVFVVAALARTLYVLVTDASPFVLDSDEYVAGARALVDGRGLIETGNGGPRPPAYVAFVALTYTLGGVTLFQSAQVLIGAATAVLVAVLAREIHEGRRGVALIAGLLAAGYPWFIFYVGGIASEMLFTFLVVATFVALLRASRGPSTAAFLAAGAIFGLAALTRSNLLVFGPLFLAWLWSRSQSRAALLFALAAAATLAPVSAYHALQGNGLSVGATGGGLAFFIGNGPDQTLLYSGTLSDEEWRKLNAVEIGPAGMDFLGCSAMPCAPLPIRDRFFYEAGFRYIQTHPVEWAVTAARKTIHAWQPWVEPRAYSPTIVAISGMSFIALFILAVAGLRQARPDAGVLCLLVAAGVTATAVLFLASHRYRFPILDPLLIAGAARPLATWVSSSSFWTARMEPLVHDPDLARSSQS